MRKASSTPSAFHRTSTVEESHQLTSIPLIQTDQKSFAAGNELSQMGILNKNQKPTTDDVTSDSNYYRNLLYDVFEAIRSASQDSQQRLLQMIRNQSSMQTIRAYLDQILSDAQAYGGNEEAPRKSKKARHNTGVEAPQFRPRIMDIRYLCGSAPYRVPAKPWTSVTDDDDLVSHLISLYMTWDYPFYAFIDRETFLVHMRNGNLHSDFCTPFLVNAMLANACDYSQYTEAYTIPGDVKTKGADFLTEAEGYMRLYSFDRGSGTRLATLQATLLLYERYSNLGNDDFGYTMLHQATEMAEEMGIINHDKLKLNKSQMSEEMIRSLERTAWGLFQVDTIVHTNFLRPSRVNEVSVDRIEAVNGDDETWMPYPISSHTRPSYMSLYFDRACDLSYIARDISRTLPTEQKRASDVNMSKQENYKRLCEWRSSLPEAFDLSESPAPHILLLGMRYHALVINLCCDNFGYYSSFSNHQKRTPLFFSPESGQSANQIALSSAREISALTQAMQSQYGIQYGHQFTMYAVSVALYTLLDQPAFDILDTDFLHLTRAFYIIARRSPVGSSLFHFFKLSVQAQQSHKQGGQPGKLEHFPQEVKEIFSKDYRSQAPEQWNRTSKSRGDAWFLESNLRDFPPPGLKGMISEYEKLSVGKEERPHGYPKGGEF
ncbi:pathway-specific regulatory protein [Penicillium antarcticum]|uniref:pathway-specific regulatory protein n=1 Tax=Penicillium antarcticum TaxID=416450 RepID=UPI00238FA054|nr:pathway-specific regulatory protein [Penicillium antarcticum]KAJ5294061.1 pathway-specific regulatory protein [Penicillium antarcticum]